MKALVALFIGAIVFSATPLLSQTPEEIARDAGVEVDGVDEGIDSSNSRLLDAGTSTPMATRSTLTSLADQAGLNQIVSCSFAADDFHVVPPQYAGTAGTATFLGPLANAQRTYQLLIHDSLLTNMVGQEITAFSWRIPTSATANWPPADVVFPSYDVYLSGSVPPSQRSLTFSENIVGPQTQVRSGGLTIPTDAYPSGGNPNDFGPEIAFNNPWLYTGGHLLVEIRHTGFSGTSRSTDAIGTGIPGYGAAFSACWTGDYAGTSGLQGNFTVLRLTAGPAAGPLGLTSPNGGEILIVDSTFNITWTTTGAVDTVRLDYSTDNGSSWINITPAIPESPAVYPWLVPNTPTTQGLVRIRSVADTTISDQSKSPFTVSTVRVYTPGDTLYNFTIPYELLLGIAKMGPSDKIVLTSGGQSNTSLTDNKFIVTTMRGEILDSSHYQVDGTTGQGFGFRDLAWDGRWLLTSDNQQVRRIDTASFTELLPRINGPGALQRGIATESPNRIWKSDFTTSAIILFDSTGAQLKSLGVPPVEPYGLAFDKWTSPNRSWLWYTQPSQTGQHRLSKVDTATGAIVTTFDLTSILGPAGSSGGLDIVNDHPDYPGTVVALMVTQLNIPGGGIISAIYLGPDSTITGVKEDNTGIPETFALLQNYPNPFNPATTIRYALPTQSLIRLTIFNLLGQTVATLVDGIQNPGNLAVEWSGKSGSGTQVASGVYFYRIEATPVMGVGVFSETRKLMIMK